MAGYSIGELTKSLAPHRWAGLALSPTALFASAGRWHKGGKARTVNLRYCRPGRSPVTLLAVPLTVAARCDPKGGARKRTAATQAQERDATSLRRAAELATLTRSRPTARGPREIRRVPFADGRPAGARRLDSRRRPDDGFLQKQANPPDQRPPRGRRLRRRRALPRQAPAQAHPRPADRRRAEHAAGGVDRRRQFHLRPGAARRNGDRIVFAQFREPGAARPGQYRR